jgi:hypothetical protein
MPTTSKLAPMLRRIALVGAAVLLIGLPARGATPAKLKVLDLAPVRVAGEGFRAGEATTVFLSQPRNAQRRARASKTGTFVVVFRSVNVDRCNSGVLVRAVGARGSRATVKLVPRLCPPSG